MREQKRIWPTRTLFVASAVALTTGLAVAQDKPTDRQPGDAAHSTGRSVSPSTQGQSQPQGPTGPLNTTTGGAPAESSQGQTPPGMQPAPDGSSKTIVDDKSQQKQ